VAAAAGGAPLHDRALSGGGNMINVLSKGAVSSGRTPTGRLSPLQWWRREAEFRLDVAAAGMIGEALAALHLLQFANWPAAVRGDVYECVRIGMSVACDPTSPGWLADCAGSLLLLRASEGSAAAATILDHLRRRHVSGGRRVTGQKA